MFYLGFKWTYCNIRISLNFLHLYNLCNTAKLKHETWMTVCWGWPKCTPVTYPNLHAVKILNIIEIYTVWVIILRILLSVIITVVLWHVNKVDNCHNNKWIFHYHSCEQAFKSGVRSEREGSNYDDCTQTIIMAIMPLYWLVATSLLYWQRETF